MTTRQLANATRTTPQMRGITPRRGLMPHGRENGAHLPGSASHITESVFSLERDYPNPRPSVWQDYAATKIQYLRGAHPHPGEQGKIHGRAQYTPAKDQTSLPMLKYSNKRCICAPKLIGRDRNHTKAVTLRADRTYPISPHYFHLFGLPRQTAGQASGNQMFWRPKTAAVNARVWRQESASRLRSIPQVGVI